MERGRINEETPWRLMLGKFLCFHICEAMSGMGCLHISTAAIGEEASCTRNMLSAGDTVKPIPAWDGFTCDLERPDVYQE